MTDRLFQQNMTSIIEHIGKIKLQSL